MTLSNNSFRFLLVMICMFVLVSSNSWGQKIVKGNLDPQLEMTTDDAWAFEKMPLFAQYSSGTSSSDKQYLQLAFTNADLREVTGVLGRALDINLVLSPQVSGVVTIQGSAKFAVDELFSLLESILVVNNLSAVRAGEKLYRITPRSPETMGIEDVFVYHLKNADADVVVGTLTKIYGQSTKMVLVADKSVNGIIIKTAPWFYPELEKTIEKLDLGKEIAAPKQVLIEVLIAEVSLGNEDRFGIEAYGRGYQDIGDRTFRAEGGLQTNLYTSGTKGVPGLGDDATSNYLAVRGRGGLSFEVIDADRIVATIQAYAQNNKAEILSKPYIVATTNEVATIDVGEEVPIVTRETAATATSPATRAIEYRPTGIILRVKPRIYGEKSVTLEVDQEVSQAVASVIAGTATPIIQKRHAKTTVTVKDGHTLFIGGLMEERKSNARVGVPILSKIPYVGFLFSYTIDKKNKTELVVLITPRILDTAQKADEATIEMRNKSDALKTKVGGK